MSISRRRFLEGTALGGITAGVTNAAKADKDHNHCHTNGDALDDTSDSDSRSGSDVSIPIATHDILLDINETVGA